MADIIYTYSNQVYANITNKCDCACVFCIRNQKDAIGEAESLWHKVNPSLEEVKEAIDAFDFTGYSEFVFCGYGEPTCALEILIPTAAYVKEKYNMKIRVNTNGLGNLYNGKNIIPELAKVVDTVSISLNAPNEEEYNKVTRPQFEGAYEAMLDFARESDKVFEHTQLTIVDVLEQSAIEKCKEVANSIGVHLRIRKFSE